MTCLSSVIYPVDLFAIVDHPHFGPMYLSKSSPLEVGLSDQSESNSFAFLASVHDAPLHIMDLVSVS